MKKDKTVSIRKVEVLYWVIDFKDACKQLQENLFLLMLANFILNSILWYFVSPNNSARRRFDTYFLYGGHS